MKDVVGGADRCSAKKVQQERPRASSVAERGGTKERPSGKGLAARANTRRESRLRRTHALEVKKAVLTERRRRRCHGKRQRDVARSSGSGSRLTTRSHKFYHRAHSLEMQDIITVPLCRIRTYTRTARTRVFLGPDRVVRILSTGDQMCRA